MARRKIGSDYGARRLSARQPDGRILTLPADHPGLGVGRHSVGLNEPLPPLHAETTDATMSTGVGPGFGDTILRAQALLRLIEHGRGLATDSEIDKAATHCFRKIDRAVGALEAVVAKKQQYAAFGSLVHGLAIIYDGICGSKLAKEDGQRNIEALLLELKLLPSNGPKRATALRRLSISPAQVAEQYDDPETKKKMKLGPVEWALVNVARFAGVSVHTARNWAGLDARVRERRLLPNPLEGEDEHERKLHQRDLSKGRTPRRVVRFTEGIDAVRDRLKSKRTS